MRRTLILLILLAGVQIVLTFGGGGEKSETLLALGFLILAAYTVGEIVARFRLPKLVGYLLAGTLFGPYLLGTVSERAAAGLEPVSTLAIALIAFLAGAELRWEEVRDRGGAFLRILSVEMGLTFVVLTGLFLASARFIPFLAGADPRMILAAALLFGALGIVHSPAVTLALMSETGARGPVARTTLGVVLLSDVVVVIFFSLVFAVARGLVPPAGELQAGGMGALVWEISGALLVGTLLGAVVALYLRFVRQELMLFAVLIAFFGIEIAYWAGTEKLLTLLTAGFVAENVSQREDGEALRHAMERSAAPVFVVFFALSGARIDPWLVAASIGIVIPMVVARIGSIWAGTQFGARWARVGAMERRHVWTGLVAQAGVAIGLANLVSEAWPAFGGELQSIVLAMIAVNQLLGPILYRRALGSAGEVVGSAPAP